MQTPKPSASASSTAQANERDEKSKRSTTIPNAIEKANEFKTRGNDCVKIGEYQKAVHYYTEAIRLNTSEPVYYTNRALCYLKQNKFSECIYDCTIAVGMDDKMVKAYYRRMQAREQMNGDLEAAYNDCKTVLRIDPKNVDAQKGLSRLEGLLKASGKNVSKQEMEVKNPVAKDILWSQNEGQDGYERIDFVTKAPHLRSKQALKRIAIGDSEGVPVTVKIDSNRTEDEKSTFKCNIDQTTETEPIKKTPYKPATIENTLKSIPKNSAQFYKTWTSLKDNEQKFIILKVSNREHY